MNKEMYKKRKEFWELKEKFGVLGGRAEVLTEVKTTEKLSTLIATIDDLLFCVSTAEKILMHIGKG